MYLHEIEMEKNGQINKKVMFADLQYSKKKKVHLNNTILMVLCV